eukprot:CAMPEP_0116918854 /NCGR_PEP_ID=MMETSP0467-20121206/20016_1 /TAXON_ID=283647 /ORGANISM="Mesodinium pulex, Strain SPMC105" /LENGTH=52 /DNA_ID=CAMNT_0004596277 /DNA_START=2208 /DNA_END=2366 /DNA_ORIENTATION=-
MMKPGIMPANLKAKGNVTVPADKMVPTIEIVEPLIEDELKRNWKPLDFSGYI